MLLYRITTIEFAQDLTGTGAYLHGGRWNSKGVRLLYTAESSALAMLEALAHVTMLHQVRQYVKLTIDAAPLIKAWEAAHKGPWFSSIESAVLPPGWQDEIHLDTTRRYGDAFVVQGTLPALKVPSALEPDSHNWLINTLHPLFGQLRVIKTTPVHFDQRLMRR